jgi:hypothetical protein
MLIDEDQYTGFLPDYSQLEVTKSPSGVETRRWMDPTVDFSAYDSFMLVPVIFYPEQEPTTEVSQATLDEIKRHFDNSLSAELQKTLTQVTTPGSRTMVIKAAITSVSREDQSLKVYQYIPIALVVTGVMSATGHRDQDTYLNVEVQVDDGASGRPVALAVRRLEGVVVPNARTPLSASNFTKAFQSASVDAATLLTAAKR